VRTKKEKVPSDLIPSVVRHRHARPRTLRSEMPDVLPSRSPAAGFAGYWINAPDAPHAFSERGCPLATAFRSPAVASAFTDTVTGSKFPACCFASEYAGSTVRSALSSTTDSGLPRFRPASTLQTRHGFAAGPCRLRFQLPLPLGIVTSLRIGASAGCATCQPAFRDCPISVRSPQPFSIARFGSGSPFPVRYCPVGLLFLKPLGTSFTMPPNRFSVNRISACYNTFSTGFIRLITNKLR